MNVVVACPIHGGPHGNPCPYCERESTPNVTHRWDPAYIPTTNPTPEQRSAAAFIAWRTRRRVVLRLHTRVHLESIRC